jgi:hypothetical protein
MYFFIFFFLIFYLIQSVLTNAINHIKIIVTFVIVLMVISDQVKIANNVIISVRVVLNFNHVNFAKAKTEIYLI